MRQARRSTGVDTGYAKWTAPASAAAVRVVPMRSGLSTDHRFACPTATGRATVEAWILSDPG